MLMFGRWTGTDERPSPVKFIYSEKDMPGLTQGEKKTTKVKGSANGDLNCVDVKVLPSKCWAKKEKGQIGMSAISEIGRQGWLPSA